MAPPPDRVWVSKRSAIDRRAETQEPPGVVAAPGAHGLRRSIGLLAPIVIAIALTAVTLSGLTTARGRIAASTASQTLLTAGRIDLIVDSGGNPAVQQLLFDESGLFPGVTLYRCLMVSYEGSFDSAIIRLHGRETGGTGLGAYLDISLDRGSGSDPECGDFVGESTMYSGRLDGLLRNHSTFDSGIRIADPAVPDQITTVRFRIEVVDDNDTQALTTEFLVLFEARP